MIAFCQELADAPAIAFDTEFVSEDTYRPELCLIQVACGDRLAVIDTMAVKDVTPFWRWLVAPGHETIVHAGREEMLFCIDAVGAAPTGLFDLQIAAGLVGFEYPAGYGALLFKLLGERLEKGETRTDWRRRPLSERQLIYALDDVRHLEAMRAALGKRLTALGRVEWLETETAAWQDDVRATRGRERWWKVSGISGLPGPQPGRGARAVAVARARSPTAELSGAAGAARRFDCRAGQTPQCRSGADPGHSRHGARRPGASDAAV